MQLLHSQAAEQTSLKELFRTRRAEGQVTRAPDSTDTSVLHRLSGPILWCDQLCPAESNRLKGEEPLSRPTSVVII